MGFRFRVKNSVQVDKAYVSEDCCGEDAPTGELVPVLVFGKLTEEYACGKHYSYLVVDNHGRSWKVSEEKVSKADKEEEDSDAGPPGPAGPVGEDGPTGPVGLES